MKRKPLFDLNGFDVVLQLPAFLLFALILTIPTTALALVLIMRQTIAQHAAWVLIGLALLWLATLATVWLVVGAMVRAIIAWADSRRAGEHVQQVFNLGTSATQDAPQIQRRPPLYVLENKHKAG